MLDTVDNDQDGLIDCEDPDSCSHQPTVANKFPSFPMDAPNRLALQRSNRQRRQWGLIARSHVGSKWKLLRPRFTNETCSDGMDNDQNGFADCEDFACRMGLFVTVCFEGDADTCRDGLDNDGDGDVDCDDSSCARDASCSSACVGLPSGSEDSIERCTDGCDNDGNGYADCRDRSCSQSQDPEVVAACTPDQGPSTLAAAVMVSIMTTMAMWTATTLAAPKSK